MASCVLKYHAGDLTEFYLEVVRQISTQFWTREEAEFVLEHREGWRAGHGCAEQPSAFVE